jgi:hypothetical protein
MPDPTTPKTRSGSTLLGLLALAVLCLALATPATAAEHRLGIGAQFLRTVDSFADDIFDDSFNDVEEDGYAWVVSYQYVPRGLFRLELDFEYYDEGFGGSGTESYTPIAFVLFGGDWYGGVGVGLTFSDGFDGDASDPFFAARVGYELDVLPGISVDFNANYRADAFSELDEADTDAITLGAIVRFNI